MRVGCCGWCESRSKYFNNFDTVELQDTFYDQPDPERLARLRSEAPKGFVFAMKAWQAITHPLDSPTWRRAKVRPDRSKADRYGLLRTTKENLEAWDLVARAARALGARVVVIQTPPSFGYSEVNEGQAREFLATVANESFIVGWEPRGTWLEHYEAVARILGGLDNVVHVVDPFRASPAVTREVAYYRLHGIGGREVNYRYRYTDSDLSRLCQLVSLGPEEVYIMFNNIYMRTDALRFKALCGAQRAPT